MNVKITFKLSLWKVESLTCEGPVRNSPVQRRACPAVVVAGGGGEHDDIRCKLYTQFLINNT